MPIAAGKLCTGGCLCPNGTINRSGQARYDATVSAIQSSGVCPCPGVPPPQCLGNTCVLCMGGPADPPECTVSIGVDAGIFCMQTGGGSGSGGSGDAAASCDFGSSETCSNGTTYSVKCSCPAAMCFCSEQFGNGGSTGGAPFMGCGPNNCGPSSVPMAYQACGFPAPQR
jgi:hypothetical protein